MDGPDEAAFEEFVVARQAGLFRTAFLLTGEYGQSEDLVQNTLERTYQHWRRVAAADNPDAYVTRVMVNLARDRWRSRRQVAERRLTPVLSGPAESEVELVEVRDVVVRALRALPMRMRTVLVLRYFVDLSESETAAVMGCSVGAVKSQASRGLARLRANLAPGLDSMGIGRMGAP